MYQGLAYRISAVMPIVIRTGLLVELFTARRPAIDVATGNPAVTSTGALSGNFEDVAGLINIVCNSAVQSMGGIAPTEMRELQEVLKKAPRHVMLDADYTAMLAGWRAGWQAIVAYPDGTITTYIIMGVETDSQTTHTRVELSEVTI